MMLMPGEAFGESILLESSKWTSLTFSKIPSNEVAFDMKGLNIKVNKSAGPLIYKLESSQNNYGFILSAEINGIKKLEITPFDEDSILRLGFVTSGEQTLSGLKKMFAPAWVKKLFSLAPPNKGINKIFFYNVTNRPDLLNKSRVSPQSDLIHEKIVSLVQLEGLFKMDIKFDTPLNVVALWLSVDGDDSKSQYEVMIKSINLRQNNP